MSTFLKRVIMLVRRKARRSSPEMRKVIMGKGYGCQKLGVGKTPGEEDSEKAFFFLS